MDIDQNVNGDYTLVFNAMYELYDRLRVNMREGVRGGVCVADLDNDGYPEMLVGNWAGGISYFRGIRHPDSTVSVQHHQPLTMTVFPNPAIHTFQINIPDFSGQSMQYALYDLQGRTLRTGFISNSLTTIDIYDLHTGVYILSINANSDNVQHLKVIKIP